MNIWPSVQMSLHNQCQKCNHLEMVQNNIANSFCLFVSIFKVLMWFLDFWTHCIWDSDNASNSQKSNKRVLQF